MSRPVVLLVEDDPSVARFVSMALEILPVAVETCPCVESALAWLRHHRAALVITDLMLPGESGMALLRQLQAEPALAAGARIVVLSAGLDHAVRQELAACGAWRALDKPVGVAALERCVQEALADVPVSSGEAGAAATAGAPHSPDVAGSAAATAESTAIQEYFSGDAALFHAYRAACLAQFGRDAAEGTGRCGPVISRRCAGSATACRACCAPWGGPRTEPWRARRNWPPGTGATRPRGTSGSP